MKSRILAVAVSVLAASCVSQPPRSSTPTPTVTYVAYPLDAQAKAKIQEGVKRSLKDPMSAMFGEIFAAKGSDNSINVCGYVNAKNSFGGYTGDKIFYGLLIVEPGKPPAFLTAGMGGTDTEDAVARTLCHNWQIPV
jgi:hypothetical protein